MARTPPALLDRDRLLAAAFAQLEEDGLDGLSMRRLAARVGVQAPALYWHFSDKAELLGLMAREIYNAAHAAVPQVGDWQTWLGQFGRALRRSFAARRDGARLCAAASPAPSGDPARHAETIAAPLVALGLDATRALSYQAVVISFTLGWESFEANGPMREFLRQMMDFDATFETGLDALVRGLA